MKRRIKLAKARAQYTELRQQEALLCLLTSEARKQCNHEAWCNYYTMWENVNTGLWALETCFRSQLCPMTWLDKLIVYFFGK